MTGGYSGDVVSDVILAADETRRFAIEIRMKPLTTRVCSPQNNGMAGSFMKTMT